MMADTTDEQPEEPAEEPSLSDRLLDLFVFLPTGVAVTVAEELPRLAERGRERLGVHVNSARAVGEFAVTAGGQELKRRSSARARPSGGPTGTGAAGRPRPAADGARPARAGTTRLRTIPYPEDRQPTAPPAATAPATPATPATPTTPTAATGPATTSPAEPTAPAAAATGVPTAASPVAPQAPVDAHVPEVASLAIPAFDTLSASQVVQRLDGLSRAELVAVRAYETSTRGRRTILSRVDQLLDERS